MVLCASTLMAAGAVTASCGARQQVPRTSGTTLRRTYSSSSTAQSWGRKHRQPGRIFHGWSRSGRCARAERLHSQRAQCARDPHNDSEFHFDWEALDREFGEENLQRLTEPTKLQEGELLNAILLAHKQVRRCANHSGTCSNGPTGSADALVVVAPIKCQGLCIKSMCML